MGYVKSRSVPSVRHPRVHPVIKPCICAADTICCDIDRCRPSIWWVLRGDELPDQCKFCERCIRAAQC
jgi:hypothetical protein